MCAYNKLNGKYACENPELLDGYLRRDWGFDGFVTSDWGATHSTVESALAGMDLEMHAAPPHYYGAPLAQAVADGKVPMARLDEMLRHIFVPMFRFGLFDKPPVTQPAGLHQPGQHARAPRARAPDGDERDGPAQERRRPAAARPRHRPHDRRHRLRRRARRPQQLRRRRQLARLRRARSPISPLEGIQTLAAAHGDTVVYVDGSSQADAAAAASAADIAIAFAADTASEGSDRTDLAHASGRLRVAVLRRRCRSTRRR